MNPLKKILRLGLTLMIVFPLNAQIPSILTQRERVEVINRCLEARFQDILPDVMRREKFDMWIVICREYNEDPVFWSLIPAPAMAARRLTMLIFFDTGEGEIEKLSISRYNLNHFYKGVWNPEEKDQWQCLADVIKERDPKRIGVNTSDLYAHADGLSATLKEKLFHVLDPLYQKRVHGADRLAIGWLETRHPLELEYYPQIVAIARSIICEGFSNQIITPGITTTQDVRWWMRQKIADLGLTPWFLPSVSLQRAGSEKDAFSQNGVIHRGDLLHCDIGIVYLRLCTDTQEMGYVLRRGETDVPKEFKKGLKLGNRLQDILSLAYKTGRSGNEILLAALAQAEKEGLKASIYSHPLGFHGHAAGPTIGLWDQQRAVPRGEYPLYPNTCYAIELNVKTSAAEWDGQEIRIALEQSALFDGKNVVYLSGRQEKFHIIH